MTPSLESIARFASMHTVGDACWEWLGWKNKDGYGRLRIGGRKVVLAHRLAWWITHGDPGKMLVCHHCDNPSCVRVDHLFIGTAKDNWRDMISKGRMKFVRGEKIGTAKLTQKQVTLIREEYTRGGVRQSDLALRYGVSQSSVQLILAAKNWAHGASAIKNMRNAPKKALRSLSDSMRLALIEEYKNGGQSQTVIAKKYGVSQVYVSQAVIRASQCIA